MEELDISLSTSKVRLMRAKEHLKNYLIECCDFDVDKYGNVLDYKHKSNPDGKCEDKSIKTECNNHEKK